ncbi:MAG: SLBB domain-containing protein [Acidobacteriaceae bacterium]
MSSLKSSTRFFLTQVVVVGSLCGQVATAQYSPSPSSVAGMGDAQFSGAASSAGGQAGAGSVPMALPSQNPGLPRGTSTRPTVLPGKAGSTPQQTQAGVAGSLRIPAAPLTDFQHLVENSIQRVVPIFGMDLFQAVPSTFAPVDNVPVTPEYVIGPGDELLVQAWGQVSLDSHYTVDRVGNIYIPQVGAVHVSGLPYAKVADYIRSQMSRVFKNFDLNVNMGQLRSIQIFVTGQAARPGSYTISSLSTLVNALFATGGPSPQGSLRDIQLRRGGKVVEDFDMYDLLLKGDKSKDAQMLPGDVVYIPPSGKMIAVVGSVKTPAIYELKADTTVQVAIDLAGGLTNTASRQLLRIERITNHHDLSVLDVNLTPKGLATELRDGDMLNFPPIVDRFINAVTLRGNVTNPGRYAWHPGMRIRDLIPNRESLITRDYWERHNLLGDSNLGYAPFNGEGALGLGGNNPSEQTANSGANAQMAALAGANAAGGNATGGNLQGSGSTSTAQGGGRASLASATTSSSVFSARNKVVLSAPDIDWSYAVIERQSAKDLSTSLIPFNLGGAVLEGDEKDNIELMAGDVVTIFSTADVNVPQSQQTRFVRLEGEFAASGVYSVLPGETLRQLVIRSGGLSPHAYLYGADFTRESTRRLQQQRLEEYADQLEGEVGSASIKASGGAVSDVDTAAAAAQARTGQMMIARLRQVRATGRIVLQSRPNSKGADSLPDLPLEDGDRLVVPRVPSTVSVEGAVYSANAFLYDPHRRVGDYLHLAGGPTRDADKSRSFILRADGSVVSNQFHSPLRSGFDSMRLYPGDTVVVPQNLKSGATMRFALNLSQIIGQMGMGLAVIGFLL